MQFEKLRKLAELNLCKDCYEKYEALIEPSFKEILSSPFAGWPETEAYLTSIIWKEVGACYFGTSVLIDFNVNDHLPDKANRELMLKIKKGSFSEKLDYLKKRWIIGEKHIQTF